MQTATCLAHALTTASLLGTCALAQAGLLDSNVRLDCHVTGFASTTDLLTVGNAVEVTCPAGSFNLCAQRCSPPLSRR